MPTLHDSRFPNAPDSYKRMHIDAVLAKIQHEGASPQDEAASLAALDHTVAPEFCKAVYRYWRKHGRP